MKKGILSILVLSSVMAYGQYAGDLNLDGNVDFLDYAIIADSNDLLDVIEYWLEADFFSIVVLPDTQKYCKYYPEIFTSQTQWILANKERLKIKFVLHEGDITNDNNTSQWNRAKTSLSILDGNMPYALVVGNHDIGYRADTRDTNMFNAYFPVDYYENLPTFGGVYEPNKLDNSFHFFRAGGVDWLVVALEFGPRDDVLDWANQVVADFPEYKAIVLTHTYLYSDDTLHGSDPNHEWNPHDYGIADEPGGVNDGNEIWYKFASHHPNISFVFSGHIKNDGTGRLVSIGDEGNLVYQMLANYQMLDLGGRGYLRIVTFYINDRRVWVRTYSPYIGQYIFDNENYFEFYNVKF